MKRETEYSHKERIWLWCLCLIGFFAVNGAFMYGLFFQTDAIIGALTNPVSLAFIVEALILMGVLAYLLTKWGVIEVHWAWFVLLSLAGSIAFALPIVLLWRRPAGVAV